MKLTLSLKRDSVERKVLPIADWNGSFSVVISIQAGLLVGSACVPDAAWGTPHPSSAHSLAGVFVLPNQLKPAQSTISTARTTVTLRVWFIATSLVVESNGRVGGQCKPCSHLNSLEYACRHDTTRATSPAGGVNGSIIACAYFLIRVDTADEFR